MPWAFTARTLKAWRPGLTLALNGERQFLNGLRSSLHWKVEPGWSETNLNAARRRPVFFLGLRLIVVLGAVLGAEPTCNWAAAWLAW